MPYCYGVSPSPFGRLSKADPQESAPEAPVIRHDRYRLDDRISQDSNRESWRAYDLVLNRIVGIQIISREHPNFDDIHRAAHQAGAVVDRRIVRVIDVVPDKTDLCIVSEWMTGLPLDEFIHTPLSPQHAVTLTQRVVEAISVLGRADFDRRKAGDEALGHGRITPRSIIVSPSGEVRLRGHLVQAATWGKVHGASTAQEDIASVGAVLQACLTATWPAAIHSRLETTAKNGDDYSMPSQLRAWLPESVDKFVMRTRIGPYQHLHINDVRLGLLALKQEIPESEDDSFAHADEGASRPQQWLRVGMSVAASVVAVAVLGLGAMAAFQSDGSEPLAEGSSASETGDGGDKAQLFQAPEKAGAAVSSTRDLERTLAIVAAWGMNEKPQLLRSSKAGARVHDNDITTGWRTKAYSESRLGKSHTEGLLIDLGSTQRISAFGLNLIGSNSDFVIRTGNQDQLMRGGGKVFAKVKGAPSSLTSRKARPVESRYALVRFTKLPLGTKGYQGGILSLKVHGK